MRRRTVGFTTNNLGLVQVIDTLSNYKVGIFKKTILNVCTLVGEDGTKDYYVQATIKNNDLTCCISELMEMNKKGTVINSLYVD